MQKMVSKVLEQQKAIHKVLRDDRKYCHLVPMWQDVDVLKSLGANLGTLSDFTDMLSAENFATVFSRSICDSSHIKERSAEH